MTNSMTLPDRITPPAWQCELSPETMAWLLNTDTRETAISPKHHFTGAGGPDRLGMNQLLSSGILKKSSSSTPDLTLIGKKVISVLNAPTSSVTLRIWGSERSSAETTVYFPGNLTEEPGVLLNEQADGKWRLAGMIDIMELISTASKIIPPETEEWVKQESFEAHLDAAAAAVLCAVIDIGRTAYRRQGFPDTGLEPGTAFSRGDISGYLDAAWGFSHFDQMISYLPSTVMRGDPPGFSEIDAAIDRLTVDDYFKESFTGRYIIGEPIRNIIPAMFALRSGIKWQRISLVENDDTAVSSRIFLTGPHGAVFIFSPTIADHVYMKLGAGDDIITFLSGEAAEILPLQQGQEKEINKEYVCVKCGAPIRKGAVFCTMCGEKIAGNKKPAGNQPHLCGNCGRKIRQGAKFCTGCGTPVE
ncbi:MAG: zinc ribbon domain-containing protein [Deltaproteobacteria bacterium]|nr:zinc ribbon domain-containing protein [Deltaproteobacteria bacterium]